MILKLNEDEIESAARKLVVDTPKIHAVLEVESAGSGFLADGRVRVQYEPHVMYKRLKERYGERRAEMALVMFPTLVAKKAGSYQSGDKEDRDMNEAAKAIDRDCALESASWGLFQIMGYHWRFMGYSTLQEFVNAMYRSEADHLDAFCRFVSKQPAMLKMLQQGNWASFAKIYNGPGYALNHYDTKLAAAYKKHGGR
jgi:hypothetical protein